MSWLVSYSRKVRYSDTDAQGIVFNGNYAVYFDDTLTDLFEEVGLTTPKMQAAGFEVVTANLTINFKATATLGDVLETRVRVARIGTKSITFELETRIEDTGVVTADGQVVFVTVDHSTFTPVEVPQLAIDALQPGDGCGDGS